MKRHVSFALGLMILGSITFLGCGDDDCPACPQDVKNAIMFAQIQLLSGDLFFYGQISCEDAMMPDVDSVKLEENNVALTEVFGTGLVGLSFSGFYPRGDLVSGDTVRIDIFTPYGNSVCELPLLAYLKDEPFIIDWSMGDTVARNTDIEINWYQVVNAEWYAVSTTYYFGLGPYEYRQNRSYTTDTTFTIPASETSMNGNYNIFVYAVTGSMPDVEGGNIAGNYVKGVINSVMGTGFSIIVGDGLGPLRASPEKHMPESGFLEFYKELLNN
jgi:hypothetical protein